MTTSTAGAPGWREVRAARIELQRKDRIARKDARRNAAQLHATEAASAAPEAPAETKPQKETHAMSAPRAARLFALPTMNGNRWTALLIWLVGAYLTRSFLIQIGVAESIATPIGVVLQWLLTKAESPLWRGQGRPPIAIIATLIDGGMNAGGTWVYTRNIGATDFWAMIQYAAQDPTITPSIATQIACAVGVGLLTAAAAEYYWNQ